MTLLARFVLVPAPGAFTPRLFGDRIVHHLVVYAAMLAAAVYLAAFIHAPLEIALGSAVLILAVGLLSALIQKKSAVMRPMYRVVAAASAAVYASVAGILMKWLTNFWQ